MADIRDAGDLERFIGEWEVTVDLPGASGVAGRTTFEWLLGRRFLVQRSTADHPDAPDGYMVITADHRRNDGYVQHYFDSRGVVRLYEMDVDGAEWTLTRVTPDFSPLDFAQRWIGRFSRRRHDHRGSLGDLARRSRVAAGFPDDVPAHRRWRAGLMGKVVVNMSVTADGFFAGPDGDISWGLVDEEVHAHFNEVLGAMSYFVEGRVVYQMMEAHWPTADQQPDSTEAEREFARIWRETPKVVYSRTLDAVGPNATLVRDVVPAEVRELKAQAAGDLSLGGADIVAAFQQHGLIDEYWLYIHPVAIGEGRPLFPRGRARGPPAAGDPRVRQRRRAAALRGRPRLAALAGAVALGAAGGGLAAAQALAAPRARGRSASRAAWRAADGVAGLDGPVLQELGHVGDRVDQRQDDAAERGHPADPELAGHEEEDQRDRHGELDHRAGEVPDEPGARRRVVQDPGAEAPGEPAADRVPEPPEGARAVRAARGRS